MSDHLSPSELKTSLSEDIRSGRVLWTRVDGLSAADLGVHRALQAALRRTGVQGEPGQVLPEMVVLDWTHVAAVSADGLAFAAVLCQALRARSIRVLCIPPDETAVAAALGHSSCDALRVPGVEWRPREAIQLTSTAPYIPLGPVHLFAGTLGFSIVAALDEVDGALERGGWPMVPELGELLMEMAQNVRTHASASHAALSVVVHRRRRPPRLQVGMADDGIGIPNAVLDDPRHRWLESYSPSRATETVVTRQLSGRGAGRGGGVLGELYHTLLTQAGATITLRSREGWVQLTGTSRTPRHESLSYGTGTQILVELPLVGR
jgi:hypothetical protein